MKDKKNYFRMFTDILKEKGRYSQGRVYLLWATIAFYLTLAVLVAAGISRHFDVELHKFEIIIEALKYALALFGGYVFGGKFVEVFKLMADKKTKPTEDEGEQDTKDGGA